MKHEIVKCSLTIKIRIGMVDCNKRWFHTNRHNSRLSWQKRTASFVKHIALFLESSVSFVSTANILIFLTLSTSLLTASFLFVNSIFIMFIVGSRVSFYKYTQDEKWFISVLYWVLAHQTGFSRLINGISSNVFASLQNRVE